MRTTYTAVIERDVESGILVGHVPGFPGAHSQGETLDELNANLREVIGMLLEDGEQAVESEFVGTLIVPTRQAGYENYEPSGDDEVVAVGQVTLT